MQISRRALLGSLGWVGALSGLHAYLNVNWSSFINGYLPEEKRKFNVAYIPVTCHLACPVTDYISKFSVAGETFLPTMFQGFPEIKEALISNQMQAGFIVAPLALALKAQGVPIRFSDERLILFRAMKAFDMKPGDIKMVEMAPPDVAGALAAKAIDAFSMGEPFPSQAEMGGFGRVLFHAREYWPDYMSCVLVVRQDMIDRRPDAVQLLVDGVARSGLWLEQGQRYRENAADFVGRYYYNQNPALLRWALTKPLNRVMYSPLAPRKADFDMVRDLMMETGVLDRKIEFEEYTDVRFADRASIQTAWRYEPGSESAR
jgi:NitT/TauT family transport system substrate-binding protein